MWVPWTIETTRRKSLTAFARQLAREMPGIELNASIMDASPTCWRRGYQADSTHMSAPNNPLISYWRQHIRNFTLPMLVPLYSTCITSMCLSNLAAHHPAVPLLYHYATLGCPMETGWPWTLKQITAAVECGPHISAMLPDATEQLRLEVRLDQANLVNWLDIKGHPPLPLKVSPIRMVPHRSHPYRAILDLSFAISGREDS